MRPCSPTRPGPAGSHPAPPRTARSRSSRRSLRLSAPSAALPALLALLALGACAPSAGSPSDTAAQREAQAVANLRERLVPFTLAPVPRDERYVAAVPDFDVRAGRVDLQGIRAEQLEPEFYEELGNGVKDIFISEAFNSQQFLLVERSELDAILAEQNFGQTGRVDAGTAAEIGQLYGAEAIIAGNVTEFGVQSSGGGGRFFGVFGGSAETVTVRVSVDVRMVDVETGIILSVGTGTATESQTNVSFDLFNVVRNLGGGASGDTIVDLAVRNAIRRAINDLAVSLPPR